jgi:hypothetical protein
MNKILAAAFIFTGFFLCGSISAQKIFILAQGNINDPSTNFNGASQVIHHENQIAATGYSETDTTCGFLAGAGSCGTATGPWVFSMNANPSVIDFKKYMYNGKKVGRVTIWFENLNTSFNYYKVVMNQVIVKMVSESAEAGVPQFYIQLDPSIIEWIYTLQKPDGSTGPTTSFKWNRIQ